MMGNQTVRDIQAQLRKAILKAKVNPIARLERELRRLRKQPKPDPLAIENLELVRDVLAKAVDAGPVRGPKRRGA